MDRLARSSPDVLPDIRLLAVRDSIAALTTLLHRANAPLAERGMHTEAAAQPVEVTARRAAEGQCFVAVSDRKIVGTITVCGPGETLAAGTLPLSWFGDIHTARAHQVAVAPEFQRSGLGTRLIARSEAWAREHGYRSMVLDVMAQATELLALCRRLGYAEAGQLMPLDPARRSVVMQKALDRSPLREHLQTQARYHHWATLRLLQAAEHLPESDYRRHVGLFFGSVHGTLNHLLLTDQKLWRPRFEAGASPKLALDTEVESDRLHLSRQLAEAAAVWLALIDRWPDSRLHGTLDYRRMGGEAVSLPFAATLTHVFNHGTHHRGQISAALTQLGQPAPELDMVMMLQEEGRPA